MNVSIRLFILLPPPDLILILIWSSRRQSKIHSVIISVHKQQASEFNIHWPREREKNARSHAFLALPRVMNWLHVSPRFIFSSARVIKLERKVLNVAHFALNSEKFRLSQIVTYWHDNKWWLIAVRNFTHTRELVEILMEIKETNKLWPNDHTVPIFWSYTTSSDSSEIEITTKKWSRVNLKFTFAFASRGESVCRHMSMLVALFKWISLTASFCFAIPTHPVRSDSSTWLTPLQIDFASSWNLKILTFEQTTSDRLFLTVDGHATLSSVRATKCCCANESGRNQLDC
jgi:hypothetical protein